MDKTTMILNQVRNWFKNLTNPALVIVFLASAFFATFVFGFGFFVQEEPVRYEPPTNRNALRFENPPGFKEQSPNPLYGPLPAPNVVTISGAALALPNQQTFLEVTWPYQTNYQKEPPFYKTVSISPKDTMEIRGTAGPAIEKIVVSHVPSFGKTDTYELKKFKPGDEEWKYSAGIELGNLGPGLNKYIIRGYFTFEGRDFYVERNMQLHSKSEIFERVLSDEGQLSVDWLKEPIEIEFTEFLRGHDLMTAMEDYISHTVSEGIRSQKVIDAAVSTLRIYKVGTVTSGVYEGSSLYLYIHTECFPKPEIFCDMGKSLAYIIERKDNTLVRLQKQSTINPLFVRYYDEHSTVDAGITPTLAIPNSKHKAVLWDYADISTMESSEISFSTEDGRPVTFTAERCLALRGHDGFVRNYNLNFTSIEPTEKNYTTVKDRPRFAIVWNDGKKNTNDYEVIFRGCEGFPACADPVDVKDSTLAGVGDIAITGYTEQGDPVYEVIPTNRELRDPIAYLERFDPYSEWKLLALPRDPAGFYANHPIIFIKEPFGRYLQFINAKYKVWC